MRRRAGAPHPPPISRTASPPTVPYIAFRAAVEGSPARHLCCFCWIAAIHVRTDTQHAQAARSSPPPPGGLLGELCPPALTSGPTPMQHSHFRRTDRCPSHNNNRPPKTTVTPPMTRTTQPRRKLKRRHGPVEIARLHGSMLPRLCRHGDLGLREPLRGSRNPDR